MVTEGPILLWEGTEPVADVWLVHGLRGDAIKTWSKGDVCWPRDLLPQEISNIRVSSWGYDSNVANWSGSVSQASIFGHGENLLRDIASKRVADHEKRALIFVGHSLGGLVIKQALIGSSQYFHNKENERLGIIYQQTEALLFLGTPHRGSDKTDLAQMVANIAKISLRKPNNKLIRTISRESDVLEQQRQAFASISNNMRIACFYEEMPTSFRRFMKVDLGVIVPEYSASIDGFSIERIGVRADHFAMCKFSASSELGFQRIIGRLREYVHLAEENIAAALAQRQLEETALAEEKERDRRSLLKSLEFDGMYFEEDAVTKAHENTFKWLFKEQSESEKDNSPPTDTGPSAFLPWLCSPGPIFWITGKAGSGKSTLMKYIFTHPKFSENLEHWAGDDQLVTAKFFIINRAPSPLQKSGVGLLRSLLVQLLEASPEFVSIITRSRGQGRREERPTENMGWTWFQLQRAFEACLAQKPRGVKICFVVDGLDEYNIPSKSSDPGEPETTTFSKQQRGFEEIVRFFLEAWNYPGIKFCLASRPLITFDDQLRDFPNINLHDLTKRDMRNYIEDQLSKRTSQLELLGEPHAKEKITNTVQEKANGVFLWVRLVIDKILLKLRNRDDFASIESELRALPDELGGPDGLYALMLLDDVVPENRAEGIRILYHILVLSAKTFTTFGLEVVEHLSGNPDTLLASIRHLYPLLLSEDDIDRRIKRFEGRVKSCCAGLAEVYLAGQRNHERPGYDSCRFIHETVQEFLIEGLVSNQKLVELKADENESSVRAVGALVAHLFLIKTVRDPWPDSIYRPFEVASSALELLDQQGVRYRASLYFEFLDEVRFIGKLLESRYGEFESTVTAGLYL